jgi:hypothetical protein
MLNEHDIYVNPLCSKSTFVNFEHANDRLTSIFLYAIIAFLKLLGIQYMVLALKTIFPDEQSVSIYLNEYRRHFAFDGAGFDRLVVDIDLKHNDNVTLTHRFAPLYHGKVCVDDSKFVVYGKTIVSTFLRPIQFPVVMVSHIKELFHTVSRMQCDDMRKCCLDEERVKALILAGYIVITPFVEVAIIITGIALVILLPVLTIFDSGAAFRSRELISKMEVFMLRGQYHGEGTLTRCFQAKNVQYFVSRYFFRKEDDGEFVIRSFERLDYKDCGDEYIKRNVVWFKGQTFADDIETQFAAMSPEQQSEFRRFIVTRAMLNYCYSEIKYSNNSNAQSTTPYISPCLENDVTHPRASASDPQS